MTATPAQQRLDRLEAYLRQDPDNLALLADTFDAALQAGEFARAEPPLRHAKALPHAPVLAWASREAHWLLAQRRWDDAERCLATLQAETELTPEGERAISHDLAFVAMQRGDIEGGLARIRPHVDGLAADTPIDPTLQLMWVRLQHRTNRLPELVAWAEARSQARQLAPGAAGAASLAALDANDGPRSLAWADFALAQEPMQQEALAARATLALAQNDPVLSRRLLGMALQQNPRDGRCLSALGFTDLLERKLADARRTFEAAVVHMPSHVGTWHGLAWARLLQGDLAGARQAFEVALELDRNFGESHGGLAVVQAMQGQREQAEASIERALRLDRAGASAHFAQTVLRGEAGDPKVISRLASRLLRHRPGVMGGAMLDDVRRAVPGLGGSDADGSAN